MTPPRLVFLRPRNADNLGAVARAMKNFGLSDWVVVNPNPILLGDSKAPRLAVKSGELLETVRRVDSLAEAVADCEWVVGTTMRHVDGVRRFTPRELATQALERPLTRWALVFGDERNGLRADDVEACHAVSFIPTSDEQPSLNLAQAVVVYAYELAQARRGVVAAPTPVLADEVALRHLRASVEAALKAVGFLREGGSPTHAPKVMMHTLTRSGLTKHEASLWTAVWRVVTRSRA